MERLMLIFLGQFQYQSMGAFTFLTLCLANLEICNTPTGSVPIGIFITGYGDNIIINNCHVHTIKKPNKDGNDKNSIYQDPKPATTMAQLDEGSS